MSDQARKTPTRDHIATFQKNLRRCDLNRVIVDGHLWAASISIEICRAIADAITVPAHPTAAPTADDAERARQEAHHLLVNLAVTVTDARLSYVAARFASIRASQATEIAALKGELLAVRKATQAYMTEMSSCHPLTNIQTHLMDELAAALASTAERAAAIKREIRARARADMLLEMDTIVAENWPRPVNPIEEMRRRDPVLPRADNATGEMK